MEAKHTPGPWEVTPTLGETAITIPHEKAGIAYDRVCSVSPHIRIGDFEANARLIAAAPEMLEILQKLDAYHNLYVSMNDRAQIKSVIAKATKEPVGA